MNTIALQAGWDLAPAPAPAFVTGPAPAPAPRAPTVTCVVEFGGSDDDACVQVELTGDEISLLRAIGERVDHDGRTSEYLIVHADVDGAEMPVFPDRIVLDRPPAVPASRSTR